MPGLTYACLPSARSALPPLSIRRLCLQLGVCCHSRPDASATLLRFPPSPAGRRVAPAAPSTVWDIPELVQIIATPLSPPDLARLASADRFLATALLSNLDLSAARRPSLGREAARSLVRLARLSERGLVSLDVTGRTEPWLRDLIVKDVLGRHGGTLRALRMTRTETLCTDASHDDDLNVENLVDALPALELLEVDLESSFLSSELRGIFKGAERWKAVRLGRVELGCDEPESWDEQLEVARALRAGVEASRSTSC